MITYRKFLSGLAILAGLTFLLSVESLYAQEPLPEGSEVVYGHQLMTPQELAAHRAKMLGLHTSQEKEAYRLEHHQNMLERAKARGVTLPEEPMYPGGMGMGPGPGPMNPGGPGPGPAGGRGR